MPNTFIYFDRCRIHLSMIYQFYNLFPTTYIQFKYYGRSHIMFKRKLVALQYEKDYNPESKKDFLSVNF